MAATPATCVFCRRGLPHERHVSPLEYAQMFGAMESYSADNVRVLDQSSVYRVDPAAAAKGKVLAS